jgi:threonine aldolase
LATVARDRGIRVHLDGARLWEAHEAYAPRSFTDIGALFDSIYVSFYKGIGALTGAMLLGSANFIDEARIWRRRHGGTLAQLHPYAASAAMRFDTQLAKMPAYHQRARTLAAALAAIPGLRVLPSPPQVNMFHLYLDASAPALAVARDRIARENGAWLAQRFTASPVPGWSSLEITVGDNLLAHDDATVAPLFARLLDHARREPG